MSTKVVIETSKGTIEAELWEDKAPKTVANFLRYVDEKFYDGTVFHRVIPGFMIQGGGFTPDMEQKKTHEPVVNHADNGFLDFKAPTAQGFGYCVFGKLTSGLDVLDAIAKVPTTTVSWYENVPATPVVILSVRRA